LSWGATSGQSAKESNLIKELFSYVNDKVSKSGTGDLGGNDQQGRQERAEMISQKVWTDGVVAFTKGVGA